MHLEKMVITGGRPLEGELAVHGAKNSALPLLAATILTGQTCILHHCPNLSDVDVAGRILTHLGCRIAREQDTFVVDSALMSEADIPEALMEEMRSSIVFLGAIVGRMGRANVSFPGGCALGPRPIDLHLSALRQLGVEIEESHGCLQCSVAGRLHGTPIALSFPSVGATENILLAAATAEGVTTISNAASEPEIVDLADFLNECGARIKGAGEQVITIEGVEELHGASHTVIPDRIVAATYLCSAAITGGSVALHNVIPSHLDGILPSLVQAGCEIIRYPDLIVLRAPERLLSIETVRTMPYPGFPTDAQPILMALSTLADGTSIFVENIFENRFKHALELTKMGADITIEGKVAVVNGIPELSGASVKATDLRGGAAMVVAALAANGTTTLSELQHIDRGYERLEQNLCRLGAEITRTHQPTGATEYEGQNKTQNLEYQTG